jgi:hypothetical protein
MEMKRFTIESTSKKSEIRFVLVDKPEVSVKKACYFLNLSVDTFLGRCRERSYVDARSMFSAIMRYHSKTEKTYAEIGRTINREHATVIHSLKKHASMTILNRKGLAMHPRYIETYKNLKDELCTLYDPKNSRKIIRGKELRLAILPSAIPFAEWERILDLKFDIVELKNIIDKHPLIDEYK